jgi:hypothetical protein
MPSVAERFIATPRLCTEIIGDSLPRIPPSERTRLRVAMRTGLAQPQVTDLRAHLAATRGRLTASPAAIAGQPLTVVLQVTEPTQATGDSPAANELSLDAHRAPRALVVSAAAAGVRRADSLRMEAPAVRTVADTLVADMPAVDTAVVEVTVAADMAAGAKCSVESSPFQLRPKAPPHERGLRARTIRIAAAPICSVITGRLRPQQGEYVSRNQICDPGRKGSIATAAVTCFPLGVLQESEIPLEGGKKQCSALTGDRDDEVS